MALVQISYDRNSWPQAGRLVEIHRYASSKCHCRETYAIDILGKLAKLPDGEQADTTTETPELRRIRRAIARGWFWMLVLDVERGDYVRISRDRCSWPPPDVQVVESWDTPNPHFKRHYTIASSNGLLSHLNHFMRENADQDTIQRMDRFLAIGWFWMPIPQPPLPD